MNTTQLLKDHLKDAFLETVGLRTMNHEEFCLFIDNFFDAYLVEVGALFTHLEKISAQQDAWERGYDAGWGDGADHAL